MVGHNDILLHVSTQYNLILWPVESQKGIITIQQCSMLRTRKALLMYKVYAIAPFWFSTEYGWTALMPSGSQPTLYSYFFHTLYRVAQYFGTAEYVEKGKFWASILSHKMCPRKLMNYWTKITDLGIIFLRIGYLVHWYQLLAITYLWEVCCSIFIGLPCIYNYISLYLPIFSKATLPVPSHNPP